MNYGIIQNRHHDKKRDGAPNPLLQDARLREMAKQMGIDAKELGGESAQNLWQLLDDMATNDPSAYQRFIQEQLQKGLPQPAANGSNQHTHESSDTTVNAQTPKTSTASTATASATPVLLPRYFSPYPGFVVKCAMFHSVKCQQQETKLFLNCCAHELVDAPKNPNSGKDVPDDTRAVPSTSNLEVPLVVGKVREMRDTAGGLCCACDVVFHPWVMRRCEWDANFKREVMKLAIHWVQHDAHVRLVHQAGKFIKSRYKGGSGTDGDIVTAKFLVEPPNSSAPSSNTSHGSAPTPVSSQSETHAPTAAMESPSELLKQIQLSRSDQDANPSLLANDLLLTPVREDSSKSMVATRATAASSAPVASSSHQKPKGKLIEELKPNSASSVAASAAATSAKSSERAATTTAPRRKTGTTGVVKKGFLLSSSAKTKALYPTGSSEGRAPSAYVNLLSRSKVVDLGDVERQKQQQEAERRKLLGDTNDLAFLGSSGSGSIESQARKSSATPSSEVDCGDFEFEQLCMDADPELNPAARQQQRLQDGADSNDPVRQLFGDGFDDLSRLLSM